MDLYCPKCGEPWDNDCFHEEASEREIYGIADATYHGVMREFRSSGCIALSTAFGSGVGDDCKANQRNSRRAELSAVAFDLMGDDTDGVASMMADAEYLGMF